MNSAVQRPFANGLAEYFVLLTTLHWLGGSSAAAAPLYHRLAWGTRSRMAEQGTRMLTELLPPTKLSTRVGHIATIVLRVLLLATETIVFSWNLLRHVLTRGTSPTIVRLGAVGPFGRTVQVQDVVAIRTGPNRLSWPHQIATNETLQLGGIQLPNEFLALRAFGDDLRF